MSDPLVDLAFLIRARLQPAPGERREFQWHPTKPALCIDDERRPGRPTRRCEIFFQRRGTVGRRASQSGRSSRIERSGITT